jgi:hypothetical protein
MITAQTKSGHQRFFSVDQPLATVTIYDSAYRTDSQRSRMGSFRVSLFYSRLFVGVADRALGWPPLLSEAFASSFLHHHANCVSSARFYVL